MKYLIISLSIIILLILNARKRPKPTESDLSHKFFPWMQLYYASKYFSPVKKAARHSRLEEYFRNMKPPVNREPLVQSDEVKLHAAGDLMIRTEISRGNPEFLWSEIGETLFDSDLTFANMEFVVNDSNPIDKTIRFSMTEQQAEVMLGDRRFGHFDILSLANNHINDSLYSGVKSTMTYLDSKGILHTGANSSPEDVDNFPIVERKGIKTAFLGYTFSTNGIPLEKDCQHATNLIRFNALKESEYDPSLIFRHIELAKQRGADIIVASLHWGLEFEYYPPERIVRRGHELLEKGIDIIVGHHPHILNPSEWYRTSDGRDTLCFYSLNGLTSQTLPISAQNTGEIAEIILEKGINSKGESITRIKDASLIPTYFIRKKRGMRSRHRIVPLFKIIEKLNNGDSIEYLNPWNRIQLRYAHREYVKYFLQEAFHRK
ncbi:CapA family protein [Spirochaeta isovalerica]|uniref:Poly-gamma-glutamate synthesis protein (Capsule biosynthesis protein) n=1 Tax=Spirochaeta isovalerica TaxID=150 RepID=A0A841R8N7_9SPIO|nr:CapA family protein [Spirochaeta isovalerica]MBB6479721.1 poly-gamma-glutamate synthesis protein (capsule biosynthesis protein) [Spirochaeta isovalerica]